MKKNIFRITPVQDKAEQKRICELCGAELRQESFAYVMLDTVTGEVMGMSQFELLGEVGVIYDLREAPGLDDFEAMFILGRQTMNFIDICGAHICRATEAAGDARLMHAIGFRDGECNMAGMFDGHCDGHAVKL